MDIFAGIARAVDASVGLRKVHYRLGAIAKVLIVTTFVEDALRVILSFGVQQESMRIAGWENAALQTALPVLSICVQLVGSLLVVLPSNAGPRAVAGCYVLLGWCVFHPFMYKQQTNWEFVLETTTIVGGLLVLLSHEQLIINHEKTYQLLPGGANPKDALKESANRLQMVGRLLITAIFVYCAPPPPSGATACLPASLPAEPARRPRAPQTPTSRCTTTRPSWPPRGRATTWARRWWRRC